MELVNGMSILSTSMPKDWKLDHLWVFPSFFPFFFYTPPPPLALFLFYIYAFYFRSSNCIVFFGTQSYLGRLQ